MTEREALLRAVCDNPDDDVPRLVFADWLDENGEPDWAEFIRVQCELALGVSDEERADELRRREQQLLAAHAVRWAEPLRGWVEGFEYRRGFVERVEMGLEVPAERITPIFDLAPVRHLRDCGQFCELDGVVDALPMLSQLLGRVDVAESS